MAPRPSYVCFRVVKGNKASLKTLQTATHLLAAQDHPPPENGVREEEETNREGLIQYIIKALSKGLCTINSTHTRDNENDNTLTRVNNNR